MSSSAGSPTATRMSRLLSSRLISFPDGDVVLRSQDGVDFRVDMTILRRASSFFEDSYRIVLSSCKSEHNAPASAGADAEPTPIPMMESAAVLNNVLRLIYPTAKKPPVPSSDSISAAHALALFKAIERLQLKSHAIDSFATNYLSTVEPSLRAWALATRFRYTQARKSAVRRYICEKKDNLFDLDELGALGELDLVGGRSLMKLMRIKLDAIELATRAVKSDSFVWYCPHHVHIPWRSKHATVIEANPFDPIPRSDAVLGAIVNHIGCVDCPRRFRHSTTSIPRAMVSRSISALLELAAEVEAQDDSVDSGEDSDNDDGNKDEAGNGNGSGNNARLRLTMPPLPPPPGPLAPIMH